jgi:hypothetical protein
MFVGNLTTSSHQNKVELGIGIFLILKLSFWGWV